MTVRTAVRSQKPVAPSVWATVTQCHRLGSEKQTCVSQCFGARSPESGLRWGLLTGPHTVVGKGVLCGAPFMRALIPCTRLHPCDQTAPKRPRLLTLSPWGLGFQPKNLGTACCPQETAFSLKSLIAEAGDAPGDALRTSMRHVSPRMPRAMRQEAHGATCVDQTGGDHCPPKTWHEAQVSKSNVTDRLSRERRVLASCVLCSPSPSHLQAPQGEGWPFLMTPSCLGGGPTGVTQHQAPAMDLPPPEPPLLVMRLHSFRSDLLDTAMFVPFRKGPSTRSSHF